MFGTRRRLVSELHRRIYIPSTSSASGTYGYTTFRKTSTVLDSQHRHNADSSTVAVAGVPVSTVEQPNHVRAFFVQRRHFAAPARGGGGRGRGRGGGRGGGAGRGGGGRGATDGGEGGGRGRGGRMPTKAKPSLLSNEGLVAALVRNAKGRANANQISVRLLYDPTLATYIATTVDTSDATDADADSDADSDADTDADTEAETETKTKKSPPPTPQQTSEIMTLSQAIQKSIDLEQDLVEISIAQETPVLRLGDKGSLEYKLLKKQQDNKKANSDKEKNVRFKVGIAENDMDRKIQQACQYLEKGNIVAVQVRCPGYLARRDPANAERLVQRVLDMAEQVGEKANEPSVNPEKTHVVFKMRPLSKKK
jgi:translation initiation factor IF-3